MFAEKIKILMIKKKIGVSDLAKLLGCTPSNITNKMNRDNFSEKELTEIAAALQVTFIGGFEIPETSEFI